MNRFHKIAIVLSIAGILGLLHLVKRESENERQKELEQTASLDLQGSYTVETYGEEGPRVNLTFQSELHNDQYCIVYKFLEGTESFREDDNLEPVTLATHASSDMIKTVEHLPELWDGPISVGIYVDYHSYNVLEYFAEIYRCDIRFRKKMTVHFAFQRSPFQTTCPLISLPQSNMTCQQFYVEQENVRSAIPGLFQHNPVNLMRNIARKGALSDLHFVMDGDMIPSDGFATKIKKVANEVVGNGENKRVLAIKTFETLNGSVTPSELQKSLNAYKSFEFQPRPFSADHRVVVGLDDWLRMFTQSQEVSTKEVDYSRHLWKEHTILHRNDPYNADYFPSTTNVMPSLIYTLCRAGYTFHVPTHVFGVHIRRTRNATVLDQDSQAMKIAINRYVIQMDELYPSTLQQCGVFLMM